MENINMIFQKQKKLFLTNQTKDISYRRKALIRLRNVIKQNEERILSALNQDLRKSRFEGYETELGMVYEELNVHIRNVRRWSRRRIVRTPLTSFPATSSIYKEPYGVTLIIGPFNYPFQLIMAPLIGAISAGNCAMIKTSEHAPNTGEVVRDIINVNFDESYLKVVNPNGGKETVEELLELKFDYIFFTGSVKVGKIIMEKAAKNLTPVTLELGGKSPCIVDSDASVELAAKRIVWGKYLNAGQTCVAPDYVFVHEDIRDKFLRSMKEEIIIQFGEDADEGPDYPRIINKESLRRIKSYIGDGTVYWGGEYDEDKLYIDPTILVDIKEESRVMEEEIFGPVLPILTFSDIDKVITYVNNNEKPLALYYFSEDRGKIKRVLKNTSSGGVTVNDTILHVASPYLPFGGVGNSGIGSYHGRSSFNTFTHEKSVLKRGTFMELPIRFAPYNNKIKWLRKLMR